MAQVLSILSLPVMLTFSRDINPFPKNITSQDFSWLDLTRLAECGFSSSPPRSQRTIRWFIQQHTTLVWLYGTLSSRNFLTNHHRTTLVGSAFLCGNQPL